MTTAEWPCRTQKNPLSTEFHLIPAKIDGMDYPVKGAYAYNTVSLKRISANTIEETDKRDGTVVEVAKMTVAPGGKKMTIVEDSKLTGRTSTFIAEKQ